MLPRLTTISNTRLNSVTFNQEASAQLVKRQFEEARVSALRQTFLDFLAFPEMSACHESISPPATGNYKWVLSD
jgi:hypothetical protein